uniref:Uncharacterized protein n=1 Tax=Arundo donax TaxID=35708 RepID=A0A0A9CBZ4_ARUDO
MVIASISTGHHIGVTSMRKSND